METKITVGTVCFIQDRAAGNILLLKRNREPMRALCTGVGGKTHFDEDIRVSCFREVKEETGLDVIDLQLKGVLKTILCDTSSSWILFLYTAEKGNNCITPCDEGSLFWVKKEEVYSQPLIGFIREVLPQILEESSFFEGTIIHDGCGNVLEHKRHEKLYTRELSLSLKNELQS